MPPDKTQSSTVPGRPLMPRLAASASTTKSPITPRLATQALRGTPSPSSVGVVSPRHGVRSPASREDLTTPAKNLINSNVTPRSSSRKSRIAEASSSSSQSTTPTISQTNQLLAETVSPGRNVQPRAGGLVSPPTVQKRPKSVIMDKATPGSNTLSPLTRTAVTFTPTVPLQKHTLPSDERNAATGSFFHASEVPNGTSNAAPLPQVKKPATFFYANGLQEEGSARNAKHNHLPGRAPSPPLSTISVKSHKSHFFHADGTMDEVALDVPLPAKVPSPELLPRSTTQNQTSYVPTPFRPPSPLKNKNNLHLTYRKGASQIISLQSKPALSTETISPALAQRGLVSPTRAINLHERSGSLSSLDTTASSPPSSRNASINLQFTGCAPTSAPTSAPAQPKQIMTPSPPSLSALPSPELASPTSAAAAVPASFAELAANARRERKVLDLEISNSSLLAVNRQLEREVRRQKAEVRRWRRMTRAGRIESLGSVASSMISGPGFGSDFSSEEEDEENKIEEGDESVDEDDGEDSDTEGDINLARLEKDEKRLRLDLSRHRQLLVDSQRMNQSLKRCVAWTEEMIGEARRALEYRVRVSDVKLGGRVLHGHYEDQEDELSYHQHGLNDQDQPETDPDLSSSFSVDPRETLDLLPSARKGTNTSAGGAERDSGVALDGDEIVDGEGLGIKHLEI